MSDAFENALESTGAAPEKEITREDLLRLAMLMRETVFKVEAIGANRELSDAVAEILSALGLSLTLSKPKMFEELWKKSLEVAEAHNAEIDTETDGLLSQLKATKEGKLPSPIVPVSGPSTAQ